MVSHGVAQMKEECLAWVETIRDRTEPDSGRYKYNRHMIRPYGVESTAHVAIILWVLGVLDAHPARDKIVRFLKSVQDPKTGYFKDPLLNDDELGYRSGAHSWQHIWDHHTYMVHNALLLCGEKPKFPLPKQSHADLDEVDPAQWTKSLDWTQPYLVAEEWMTTVKAYIRKHDASANATTLARVVSAFEAVESTIAPESGLPVRLVKGNPDGQGLGGIFKLLFAYVCFGRKYPHADNAVRSILKMQTAEGDFAGANMCMNWDAVVALRFLTDDLRKTSLRSQVVRACETLVERLCRDYRKEDGGFSFFHNTCLPNHNSVRISAYYPESDVLGTAMCLDCIAIVDRWSRGKDSQSFLDVWAGFGTRRQ